MSDRWEAVIGLEVHAQLMTKTKLFSTESTVFGATPNSQVSAVCAGLPGSLPVLNTEAVELCLRAGAALGCQLQPHSRFARKHYFYPDLPKGYQISQYEDPIFQGGCLEFPMERKTGSCRLKRIHIEEDAGKTIHREGYSLVDLNRAGLPLIEVVTEPELNSSQAVGNFLKELRKLLRFLDVCDGNMEEGSFRCDANVSVRLRGQIELGTRTELKNLNSFSFVQQAIEYELERQIDLLESGGQVIQETRLFDTQSGVTRAMRGKEEAEDYRYFPDPDLPPLQISGERWEEVCRNMPELPAERRLRYRQEWQIPADIVEVLLQSRGLSDYFEKVAGASQDPRSSASLLVNQVLPSCGSVWAEESLPLSAQDLAKLVRGIFESRFSNTAARRILERVLSEGDSFETALQEVVSAQDQASSAMAGVVFGILEAHPVEVAQFREGKHQLIGFFMGIAMKRLAGQADSGEVRRALLESLQGKV